MILVLIASRVLFSLLFLLAGADHIANRRVAIEQVARQGLPMASVLVDAATVVLLAGGASVLLGIHARIGAALLAAFLMSSAVLLHGFWRIPEPHAAHLQRVQFMKNVALAGGALLFVHFGSGALSLVP